LLKKAVDNHQLIALTRGLFAWADLRSAPCSAAPSFPEDRRTPEILAGYDAPYPTAPRRKATTARRFSGLHRSKCPFRVIGMDISVTELKQHCLEVIRRVERTRRSVTILRRGKVVAELHPPTPAQARAAAKPWRRLIGSAECDFAADESVLNEKDFEALR
jgi:antitoxin (DNA-binding transcriptional repressor) of toxin-antitoxin stability system